MEESRRTRMTKRLMKDALLELMEEKPFAKISVSAICETADVNRSTFYAYYEEPLQLLREIENDVFAQMPVLSPSTRVTDRTNIQQDKSFMKRNITFFEYIKKNARMFRILLINSEDIGFRTRMLERMQEMYHWRDTAQEEYYNHFRYVYIAGGALSMMIEWIKQDFPCTEAEFAKMSVDIISS